MEFFDVTLGWQKFDSSLALLSSPGKAAASAVGRRPHDLNRVAAIPRKSCRCGYSAGFMLKGEDSYSTLMYHGG